ncbi:hypothetical protein LZ634_04560, partial [Kluyvera intermedia]|uniref:hypothetical protein n=1 Tax=Kluyvera intermedia TaxID=61648 RepID=UPI001F2FBF7E
KLAASPYIQPIFVQYMFHCTHCPQSQFPVEDNNEIPFHFLAALTLRGTNLPRDCILLDFLYILPAE